MIQKKCFTSAATATNIFGVAHTKILSEKSYNQKFTLNKVIFFLLLVHLSCNFFDFNFRNSNFEFSNFRLSIFEFSNFEFRISNFFLVFLILSFYYIYFCFLFIEQVINV